MLGPDDLALMNEEEKLELVSRLQEGEDWRETFELIYLKLADDESPKVRAAAIVALWDLADPKHIEMLMRKAESDPDPEVRGKAASVLGIYIYEGSMEEDITEVQYLTVRNFLLGLARSESEPEIVRRMAIEALSFDDDEEIRELISWAYEQTSVNLKLSALFAMGRSGSVVWEDILLKELDSQEQAVCIEAINACAESGLASATPRLRNLAASSDREVCLAAIWALSQTGGPGALETLEVFALSQDEEVRKLAEEAIEEYLSLAQQREAEEETDEEEDDE